MGPPTPPNTFDNQQPYSHDDGAHLQAVAAPATADSVRSEHIPTANNTAANGAKRRGSGAPSSRGVANLTADQLAKKRANDREAQRAIRERTRNTIESLERRIRELESQQPFQELQRVMQERDRALAECEELRKRLIAVAGIAGGQQPTVNELAALTEQQGPLPPLLQTRHTYQHHPGSPYEQQYLHPDLRSPRSSTAQSTPPDQVAYQAGDVALRKWSPSLDHPPNVPPQTVSAPYGVQSHNPGERLGVSFLLDTSHRQVSNQALRSPIYHSPHVHDLPVYHRLPLHGASSCPLDSLLLNFHASQRRLLQEGASQLDAIGPEYPAFSAMIESGADHDPHPISVLLIDILSKFPDISRLPEKIAVLYIMFLVMRWLICPCKNCYERLPEWCRPVTEQLEQYHVVWGDYLPWPHMRKMIVLSQRPYKFDDFFVPYCMKLSLNWPLPHDCVLLPMPAEDSSIALKINPAFEHHLRDLRNWTLGNEFMKVFPELVDGSAMIKDG